MSSGLMSGGGSERLARSGSKTTKATDGHNWRNNMIKLGITYEIITPESAEHGDVEERGWLIEPFLAKPGDLARAMLDMRERGPVEASSSEIDDHTWFTAYDTGDRCGWNFETGGYENLSLHIEGCTLSTRKRIHNLLTS